MRRTIALAKPKTARSAAKGAERTAALRHGRGCGTGRSMLVLDGASAFSPATLAKRLALVQRTNPDVSALAATYVHFVATTAALEENEFAVLRRLLTYGPRERAATVAGESRWVVPRLGTISPWSSKATDIARSCGLQAVGRIERGIRYDVAGTIGDEAGLRAALFDRMTESVLSSEESGARLFDDAEPRPLGYVPLGSDAGAALSRANRTLGLALSDEEVEYLAATYATLGRDPTDVELMMFAQANSEHCRHKIFNATFTIDGEGQERSLFQMIRNTTTASPDGVLSAYRDNAAVIEGPVAERFFPSRERGTYATVREPVHTLLKVETHNHPTAIAPFPGAATGSGGEIRDEGATGRGAKPKAGLTGFTTSNLRIPGCELPWEVDHGKPSRIVSALDVMIEGPLGGAAFNNEFGRPSILGYFRAFELDVPGPSGVETRGYHKPVMLAGGIGAVRPAHVAKGTIPAGAALVVLGGPAMLIGLGGGAASSVASGAQDAELDFASVQRDNAEVQRRCQEVIDRCVALGDESPIVSIHDVGAGGLSNALPELVHESHRGAALSLRAIPTMERALSPLELWCNEAQERYVLAIAADRLTEFEALCARERCPYAVVGNATLEPQLRVDDTAGRPTPIDMPLDALLGKPPRMHRTAVRVAPPRTPLAKDGIAIEEAALRVLRAPTVGDKSFLITIGDRSVGGHVSRDPMVGPRQVPVADAGVTTTGLFANTGEAMALGERSPVALLSAAASARLAVAEVVTNLACAPIARLGDIKLSANWMAAAGHPGEDARLFEAVHAVGIELCPALGIAIPVGKDSMSMRTVWGDKAVVSPVTLIATGLAQVLDVRRVVTPELRLDADETQLVLVDLGRGRGRLGASVFAQTLGQLGDECADLDDPQLLIGFFAAMQQAHAEGLVLAYHDRSDGGLLATLAEMGFASGVGLEVTLPSAPADPHAALFAEELGAVLQVTTSSLSRVRALFAEHELESAVHVIGRPAAHERLVVRDAAGALVLDHSMRALRAAWSETTHAIARLRDDAACADEEHAARLDPNDQGLTALVPAGLDDDVAAPFVARGARPRVAILREQGVNGQVEMAAAFFRAGFDAVDVHMTDLLEGRTRLDDVCGLVACGGFSYGDVLGAGEGWAKSILFHARARAAVEAFFAREGTFTLGVCNGCQMLTALREIIPGGSGWPRFVRNRSERFEARLALVEVPESPSLFLRGMTGARLPVVVSHGEGRLEPQHEGHVERLESDGLVALRYVHPSGTIAMNYPQNPNGSPHGITGVTTRDGRITALMPHPERVFRTSQLSWHPRTWGEDSPWMRFFRNARAWVG